MHTTETPQPQHAEPGKYFCLRSEQAESALIEETEAADTQDFLTQVFDQIAGQGYIQASR